MTREQRLRYVIKPAVFLLCLVPLALLGWQIFADALGPNPVEELLHRSGDWALRLLLLTLTMTPLRRLTGWSGWVRLRRMLGLYAFFYASLHFLIYLWFDREFLWREIIVDIGKRPYITVGFAALLILLPLAVTSTRGWQRRLGRNWARLHQWVYLAGLGGVMHFIWLVKADVREPLMYAAWLLTGLLIRAWWQRRQTS
ncbi:MAG: protein-methionine-sulfoxide reductase heme-binding subunit MsrQ [Granulosicoccaceae bacterium]|jgi:sulfoxide reductase heme-binding subunit YedZ